MKVYISNIGVITAMGDNVEQNKTALLAQKDVLDFPKILETKHKDFVVGEVPYTNEVFKEKLNTPSGKISNRSAFLGIWAIKELLKDVEKQFYTNDEIAFINATTVGSMSDTEKRYAEMIAKEDISHLFNKDNQRDCAATTKQITDYFGFKGFTTTISTACSSASNAIQMGARLIEQGVYDRVICGGTDALSLYTLNGFNALKNIDKQACKPFDQNRAGLNLGEGAAYVMLESEKGLAERKAAAMAVLTGYATTNEAHHPTAPSPDGKGAKYAMETALHYAKLTPKDIDFISAHGTATIGNDLSEGMAIKHLFGDQHPPFIATKCYTGHTLAASGVVALVYSIMSLQEKFIPANLRFETPMEETGLKPNTVLLHNQRIKNVLINSFGFGGSNVSLVVSSI